MKIRIIVNADTEEDKKRVEEHFRRFCLENFQKPFELKVGENDKQKI
jgi:hypothetical protein